MKRNLLFVLMTLVSLMGAQIAVNAQDLTLSDLLKSGCQRGTRSRANENETVRTIILTKEGTILTVQILGFVSNCATEGFDIIPNMSGGSDGEPVSVSLGVEPIEPDVASICICPFNVSFTLHGLETNSFYFTCWWYEGQVSLTEGEPLTLESITEPVHVGEWYYTIDKVNHTAIVRGVDGETDDLTIPWFTYYEGEDYFVTGIDEAAFLNDKTLSSVNIPTNLTHIGYYAFAYCSNLKDVYCFADQVPTTGSDVFQGTPIASATLHVPAGLIDKYKATAPWNEFGNIVGEGNVTIDGLNYYLNSSFYTAPLIKGNNWEGELDIPSEVSFYEQTYTVTSMALTAFHGNSKLTKVRIPKSIENILRGYYSTNPYEDVPTGLVSPDHMNPFRGCTALESIEVDEENPSLKSVDGVLFSQDGKGYYYYLTNSYYGTGLYCYPAGARRESYTIPDGVEWISSEAFGRNQYISTLTIPSSMKMIYYSVFSGCSNLKNVYCYAEDVPIAFSEAFKGFPVSSATLHVPAGSLEKYKATAPWNEFGNIVSIEPPVYFTAGQVATIILPITPDASKGMYYRLDRREEGKVIFEQELQPQAHVPYIIVPNEDFSIDSSTLDLAGLSPDTASIAGISFIGSYCRNEPVCREGWYIDIIDTTPDCQVEEGKAYTIGALRAYLTVNWDDPINHEGTKGPGEKMEVVLRDYGTNIASPIRETGEGAAIYDLSGRRILGIPTRGIYLMKGKLTVIK